MRLPIALVLWWSAAVCFADASLPLSGRVMDNAGVLSQSVEQQLTSLLEQHEQETTNQIVVLTLSDLDGDAIEQRALDLARGWGLGQADKDNGVLLLVAMAERQVRIEVGYGLEGALTDATSANIIRSSIRPRFRRGDFDGGVYQGVADIVAAIKGEYTASKQDERRGPNWSLLIFIAFIIFQFIWPMFFRNVGGKRRRGGRYYGGAPIIVPGGGFGGSGGGFGGGFGGGGGGFGGGGASGGW